MCRAATTKDTLTVNEGNGGARCANNPELYTRVPIIRKRGSSSGAQRGSFSYFRCGGTVPTASFFRTMKKLFFSLRVVGGTAVVPCPLGHWLACRAVLVSAAAEAIFAVFIFFFGKVWLRACFLKYGTQKRACEREARFLIPFSYYRDPGVVNIRTKGPQETLDAATAGPVRRL
jgi:hypothetical protein